MYVTTTEEAVLEISIHALHYRVRCAGSPRTGAEVFLFQSTHSITECDFHAVEIIPTNPIFQSTHSITECDRPPGWPVDCGGSYFNPRTPLQSAMLLLMVFSAKREISIHALHYRVRYREGATS